MSKDYALMMDFFVSPLSLLRIMKPSEKIQSIKLELAKMMISDLTHVFGNASNNIDRLHFKDISTHLFLRLWNLP